MIQQLRACTVLAKDSSSVPNIYKDIHIIIIVLSHSKTLLLFLVHEHVFHDMHVEVRGKFVEVDSLLPPCGSHHRSSSDGQVWRQAILSTFLENVRTGSCYKAQAKSTSSRYQ